ncbi:hypothetical protein GOP47_0017900 [Adiantum capillus-veneris]|uniref:Maternal effect embryo arrest protein n=1 Tax=Adiantum capillus-veneris TaxID=13818 RepID=A0A9D4ZB04_ADICA|nr:hypothetical protein GOP47_0017900 [Adiantum capillus-veneris]
MTSGSGGEKNMASLPKSPDSSDAAETTLHISALDALVNVNSIFSGVVFIGLAFSSNSISLVASGADDPCNPSSNTARRVVLCEVLAFAAYLLSSLIAQGLKLQLALIGAKKVVPNALVPINERFIRIGMAITAFCTAIGTIFLTLSIIFLIELRLGALSCPTSAWSKSAAIPLAVAVIIGVLSFLCTVLYAFFA